MELKDRSLVGEPTRDYPLNGSNPERKIAIYQMAAEKMEIAGLGRVEVEEVTDKSGETSGQTFVRAIAEDKDQLFAHSQVAQAAISAVTHAEHWANRGKSLGNIAWTKVVERAMSQKLLEIKKRRAALGH